MGWNDARVSLVANGVDSSIDRAGALNVSIIRTTVPDVATVEVVPEKEVQLWLTQLGFELRERSSSVVVFQHADIEFFASLSGEYVYEIILTFRLDPGSRDRVAYWNRFVDRLNQHWGFKLRDARTLSRVEPAEFTRLLGETQSWQDFAAHYHWPALQSVAPELLEAQDTAADQEADQEVEMLSVLEQVLDYAEAA